jgi:hypothetical protein
MSGKQDAGEATTKAHEHPFDDRRNAVTRGACPTEGHKVSV